MRVVSSIAIAALLTACSAVTPSTRVHAGSGGAAVRPRYGGITPVAITEDPAEAEPVRDVLRPVSSATRRVCRGAGAPSGWIATNYEPGADGECVRGNKRTKDFPVALLVSYKGLPVGSTLDVCADQHTPFNWQEEASEQVDVGKCQGAGKDGASATKRIYRVR